MVDTCEEYQTPGLPVGSTPVAAPVTSLGRKITPELEELGSLLLTVVKEAARVGQSLREERTGAPPAGGQKK